MQLTLDNRVKLQTLLTAAGYWATIPNENFSNRLFEAIQRFQSDNNFVPNGVIDTSQFRRLTAAGGPLLNQWGFQRIRHPSQDAYIWVPLGLGLTAQQIRGRLEPFRRACRVGVRSSEAARRSGMKLHGGSALSRPVRSTFEQYAPFKTPTRQERNRPQRTVGN
jgi:peptidoglycan hydrolase-like protein with peptidoglycan-binding domain